MFFTLSKLFWALVSPLTFIALLLLAGVLLRRWQVGKGLIASGVALFLLAGLLPVGPNLVVFLETRYAAPEPRPDEVTGIVVLGGAVNAGKSRLHGQTSLNEYGERLTEAIKLSRLYPHARIIYSGGTGAMDQDSGKEADEIRNLLPQMGIPIDRFVFEDNSRNTYENMVMSKQLASPQAGDKWLLVTSAFHMPRSMAIFRAAGWDVTPWPAGYLEDDAYVVFRDLDVLGNFYKLQVATKEIVGIIAYRLTGKL